MCACVVCTCVCVRGEVGGGGSAEGSVGLAPPGCWTRVWRVRGVGRGQATRPLSPRGVCVRASGTSAVGVNSAEGTDAGGNSIGVYEKGLDFAIFLIVQIL